MATLRKVSSVTFLGLLLILVQWTLGAAAPQNAATIVKAVPKDCVADSPGSPIHNITSKDLVEGGNLVIKGNACIGSLCGDADATFPVLRLKATDVNILFDDQEVPEGGSGSSRKWAIRINPLDPVQSTNLDQMSVRDVDNGTDPFTVAGGAPNSSLFIAGTGRVGIGTASPSQNLHVFGSDGFTGVLVQETNATTTSRRMLELKNNGASRLDLTDTSTGFTWGINDNFGDLRLNRSLTNGTVAFDLQPYGNLTIAGTNNVFVTATGPLTLAGSNFAGTGGTSG